MKRFLKMALGLVVFLLVFVSVLLYFATQPDRQLYNLDRDAKKLISGAELQSWATNLLVAFPAGRDYEYSELRTNIPIQLLGLAPKLGPQIVVRHFDDPAWPSYVELVWGSGFAGHAGFEIGPTNFAGYRSRGPNLHRTNKWQEGIYYWRGQ